ncbi:MAG: helix-turn-helix domain-containing protein [Armatimonadia bacterium]|nr:helix-turn-helix domain-containing protein [Rhodoglobus sp.]
MTDTNWITRPELGERLRISEKTLAQWAVKKTGPPYAKFGRHVRYRLDLVEAWEENQLRGVAS